ncbi:DUF2294 domain-containing protein [Planococcus sp. FY231025]|uniref:DUF2294 domain-containing protein n=1 Tax=Planococcus sp. FY231025 TaxID=3455699 RepID=UPI003F90A96F
MPKERTVQTEISGFISTLMRQHFDKGPTSVYVTMKRPFITIHFRGFNSPMEKVLLKQDEWKRVLETRDLMMSSLKPLITDELLKITGLEFKHLYADWNLPLETGMIFGVMDEKPTQKDFEWHDEADKQAFYKKIEKVHEEAEKKPGGIESYWLSDRTLIIKRVEILVGIEKALIGEGYTEILKLAKRPLERSLLDQAGLENILHQNIQETFLDWNFDEDLGYIVFVLSPPRSDS